ncbi:MAG TPA: NTP transferase domain-containing protein [Micropepsaceae bacterium]|nr:NTP transferase domain-containing protein [Micropepsaceae bacterium]
MSTPAANPRVVAIVQARMGSTRLPGKVLRSIAGKPLLWHVIHRLRRAASLDEIVIATSTNPRDDAILTFCREEDVPCVRGPEDDVLARFALAAEAFHADVILRVSADAPLLDGGFIDHLVQALIAQDGDYVTLPPGALCAHEGIDPFSRRALDKLVREASHDPVAREHVSGYFKLHPDFVNIVCAAPYETLARKSARLTIDTPDDLAFIETLHERLKVNAGEASLSDLLLLLEREPHLAQMNAHVRQKPLEAQGGLALIRCDGGGMLGFGHVKRCLTLARALRDREGLGVLFALNGEEDAAETIRQSGFETVVLPRTNQTNAFMALGAAKNPDMLIADARTNLSRDMLTRLRQKIGIVAVIDDASDRRLAATHAYFPPVPQVEGLSWNGARPVVRVGWEWSLLGFDPARLPAKPAVRNPARPTIVVSMGGSDPLELTRLAARALAKITTPFRARFIIGPGFRNASAQQREIEAMSPAFEAVQGVTDLGAEFSGADLALVTFGVTAYELAALGVPALYLALSDDHALSASSFENAGMGAVLGLGRILRADDIARKCWQLLTDADRRRDMRAAGLNTIDGRAGNRIAADLTTALAELRNAPKLAVAAS